MPAFVLHGVSNAGSSCSRLAGNLDLSILAEGLAEGHLLQAG